MRTRNSHEALRVQWRDAAAMTRRCRDGPCLLRLLLDQCYSAMAPPHGLRAMAMLVRGFHGYLKSLSMASWAPDCCVWPSNEFRGEDGEVLTTTNGDARSRERLAANDLFATERRPVQLPTLLVAFQTGRGSSQKHLSSGRVVIAR